MTPMHFMLNTTFMLSILGLSIHRMHLVSALLCIEGMMLALFIAFTSIMTTMQLSTLTPATIMLLTFAACEAGTGLAILVATSRTHNNDNLKTMNLLQC